MMYRILLLLFMSFIFQSCQVAEDVASSKQIGQNNFPGASIITVLPSNGWKKLGDDIDVSLVFALPMNVKGMPYISAQIGFNTRRLYYVSGNGSTNLIFRYSVSSSDLDNDGIVFSPSVTLNGGAITYIQNNQLVENISTSLTIPTSMIKVDGIPPYPMQVTAPNGGNYATGQRLQYFIDYSEKVYVSGAPNFGIYLNSGTVSANFKSGSGTTKLEFSRVLAASDIDADGFFSGTNLNSFATITDEAGNTAPSYLFSTHSPNILLNVVFPSITSITPPANLTYILGQQLNFSVNFSQAVNVTGIPAITINLSTGSVLATYVSGSGTSTLIFRYTVLPNQVDSDGINLVTPLVLNGATIKNLAGTQNAALVFSAPVTTGILIDAATGPYVVSTVLPANGFYLENQNIDFKLKFNRLVNVTHFPRLPVIVGSTTTYANYISGGGSDELTFRYIPTVTQEDLDGITLSGPIDLNGGTIQDSTSKLAILNYVPASTVGIKVDCTFPTISNINWSGTGILQQNQQLNFSVQFSEVVNITGSPILSIVVGATHYNAVLISGNGTNTLNFRHIIQAGDLDLDGVEINSPLLLNLGTIKDPRGHDSLLVFDSIVTTGHTVDAKVPTITTFTGPANATYKIGDNLDFVINWSEPVYVSGTPKIALTVGTTPLYASYNSSLSTSTSSVFRYTVQATHLDTDGIATSGIVLSGGLIRDAVGNNANLAALSAPDLTGVLVDGVVPYVTSISVPANATYKVGQILTFGITWSENVIIVGSPHLKLIFGSTQLSSSFTYTGQNSANFSYTVLSGQLDSDGITALSTIFLGQGITIKDSAGNDSCLQINLPPLTEVKVDAIVPTILAVAPPANETYKYNDNIDFKVLWSEPIVIDTSSGSPRISLTIGATTPLYATYVPGESTSTMSVFRHTVANTEVDNDGISILGTSIGLNLSTIKDIAGNDAALTFIPPSLTGVLVDGVSATILSWTPPPNGTYGIGDEVFITVHYSENVFVDTSEGIPYLRVFTNGYDTAVYDSGSNTQDLVFKYTVNEGQSTGIFGLYLRAAIQLNGATIQDLGTNNAYLTFPSTGNYITYSSVQIDGNRPTISSSSSANITRPSSNNVFKPGNTIEYDIRFNEAVTVTGTPRLTLSIGGTTKYANYFAASSTSTSKKFRYNLDSGNVLLDLDGIDVSSSIDMNGGSIKDAAGNDFTASLAFSETDYVHYDFMHARYHIANSDYSVSTSSCPSAGNCITGITDITGNGKDLTASFPGPQVVAAGFGSQLTNYIKFNNISSLSMPKLSSVKYVILVLKTPSDASINSTPSIHTILNKKYIESEYYDYYGGYDYTTYEYISILNLSSTSSQKKIIMSPTSKLKVNNGAFSLFYTSFESSSSLWLPDATYIMTIEFSSATNWDEVGSLIGGSSFKGGIAEMIFLSSGAINEASHITPLVNQLNAIHGAY